MKELIPFFVFCAAVVLLYSASYLYFYIRGKRRKILPGIFYQVRYNPILDRFTLNDVPMERSHCYELLIVSYDPVTLSHSNCHVVSVRPEPSFWLGWHFVFDSDWHRVPFRPVGLFCRIPPVPEFDENGEELGGGYEF